MSSEFDLEAAIDAVYLPYTQEIEQEAKAAKAEAERILAEAIAKFRKEFDLALSPQIQEALEIKFSQNDETSVDQRNGILANFRYANQFFQITRSTPTDHWYVSIPIHRSLNIPADTFEKDLLIALGEIRSLEENYALCADAEEE